jgi:hypothetical protein
MESVKYMYQYNNTPSPQAFRFINYRCLKQSSLENIWINKQLGY